MKNLDKILKSQVETNNILGNSYEGETKAILAPLYKDDIKKRKLAGEPKISFKEFKQKIEDRYRQANYERTKAGLPKLSFVEFVTGVPKSGNSMNKKYRADMERRKAAGLPVISFKEYLKNKGMESKKRKKLAFSKLTGEKGLYDAKKVKLYLLSPEAKTPIKKRSTEQLKQDVLRGLKAKNDFEKGIKFHNADEKTKPQWLQTLIGIGKSAAGELLTRGETVPDNSDVEGSQNEPKPTILGMPKPIAIGAGILVVSLIIFGTIKIFKK